MLKLDIGCGPCKRPGYTGVDRFPLPGVSIVADLDKGIPIDSDTVDEVYSSHCLEHVKDITFTMSEIYRICKHGALVYLVLPYNEQKLNLANPYHISPINEHSPRFWTNDPRYPSGFSEDCGHVAVWGLKWSDHSDHHLDIRTVEIKYHYYSEYCGASEALLSQLRNSRFNVCDQIIFKCVVWKNQDENFDDYTSSLVFSEPQFILERDNQQRNIAKKNANFWNKFNCLEKSSTNFPLEFELFSLINENFELKAKLQNLSDLYALEVQQMQDRLEALELNNVAQNLPIAPVEYEVNVETSNIYEIENTPTDLYRYLKDIIRFKVFQGDLRKCFISSSVEDVSKIYIGKAITRKYIEYEVFLNKGTDLKIPFYNPFKKSNAIGVELIKNGEIIENALYTLRSDSSLVIPSSLNYDEDSVTIRLFNIFDFSHIYVFHCIKDGKVNLYIES